MDYNERWREYGELSSIAGGNAEGYGAVENNTELPRGLAIPLLDAHPEKLKTRMQTSIRMPVFTVALLTAAKWWEQPKCPSTNEWINKCGVDIRCGIIQP